MAIGIGVALGFFFPGTATKMKPFGDAFIKLIKMMIAPIIFTTVVVGIAKIGNLRVVGRLGLKSIIYFELVSTLALVIGLVVINLVRPGVGSMQTSTDWTSVPWPATRPALSLFLRQIFCST